MNNRGVSCLGVCHPLYNVNGLIASFKHADVIRFGWLDHFFNANSSAKAGKLMRLKKKKFCRIHVINGPGLNNKRTQPHEITYKETTQSVCEKLIKKDKQFTNKYIQRLQALRKICNLAPPGTLELAISPWLEHAPIPRKAWDILVDLTVEVFPEAFMVDNPVSGTFFSGNLLTEKHGLDAPSSVDIADLDGIHWEACDLLNFAHKHVSAKVCYIWGFGENGTTKEGPWLPPQKRKAFTTKREFDTYQYFVRPDALVEHGDVNPIDLAGISKRFNPRDGGKKGFLWKLGDRRNYAICLLPREFGRPKTVIVKKDGKIFDKGKVRGLYTEDGSNRAIIDFTKHTSQFPDFSVVVVDGKFAWVLDKPQFRID